MDRYGRSVCLLFKMQLICILFLIFIYLVLQIKTINGESELQILECMSVVDDVVQTAIADGINSLN